MHASRQTKIKLKKGFHNAPISYRVLMVQQFNKKDKEEIAKGLVKATTPKAAEVLLPRPSRKSKWSMRNVTLVGDFGVVALLYKGLEVAVFWRRQTSEIIPEPTDPVPEGVLEHPDDVWIRFDLFGKSARQLVGAAQLEIDDLNTQLVQKDIEISSLQRVAEADSKTIKSLQGQLQVLQKSKPKKK